jgi:threonine synthase
MDAGLDGQTIGSVPTRAQVTNPFAQTLYGFVVFFSHNCLMRKCPSKTFVFGRITAKKNDQTRRHCHRELTAINYPRSNDLFQFSAVYGVLNEYKIPAFQKCLAPTCQSTFDIAQVLTQCPQCGEALDVCYEWDQIEIPKSLKDFAEKRSGPVDRLRFSGVWRFRELINFVPADHVVTLGEGQTILQQADGVCSFAGMDKGRLFLQYEGLNPSGSFKDNGMSTAFSHAQLVGAKIAACASTGNTSASLAMFSAVSGLMKSIIFIGSGKIAFGKLSQALDFGALTLQIDGDFDDAMQQVRQVCPQLGIYLVNSVNPFRIEGQKTIMLRVLEALNWEVPDWIVVPGGNLGNSSSFGKMFGELLALGLIDRAPRLAVINAKGANPLFQLFNQHGIRFNGGNYDRQQCNDFFHEMKNRGQRADTLASAIEINRPVNLSKCLRALEICDGVVGEVSDEEILDAKARIGAAGMGCEPASAASVAGLRKLTANQIIGRDEKVVCVLTGHQLKDPDVTVAYHSGDKKMFDAKLGSRGVERASFANSPLQVANNTDTIIELINAHAKAELKT